MFIEMIDLLRCVNAHEDTWLVASFREVTKRMVIEGTLGCPVCSAQYPIQNGVADFTLDHSVPSFDEDRAHASHLREELATRAGAYLDATQPGATIVLGGLWAYAAQELADMADVRILALNAPSGVKESEKVGLVNALSLIPLASGSVHAVALDAWFANSSVDEAVRVVKPGGRIVGSVRLETPPQIAILAHDEHYWVAENPAEVISLRRARLSQ